MAQRGFQAQSSVIKNAQDVYASALSIGKQVMSIPAIGSVGFTPMVAPTLPTPPTAGVDAASQVGAASSASGGDFGQLLSKGLDSLQGLHSQADTAGGQGRDR